MNVRPAKCFAAANKSARFKMVAGADASTTKQPFSADLRLIPPLQSRVERDRFFTRILQVHFQMILQVLTDARQMVNQRNGMRF